MILLMIPFKILISIIIRHDYFLTIMIMIKKFILHRLRKNLYYRY